MAMREIPYSDPVLIVLERHDAAWVNLLFNSMTRRKLNEPRTELSDLRDRVADALYTALTRKLPERGQP